MVTRISQQIGYGQATDGSRQVIGQVTDGVPILVNMIPPQDALHEILLEYFCSRFERYNLSGRGARIIITHALAWN